MKEYLIQARYAFIAHAYAGNELLNVEDEKGGISERYQIAHKVSSTDLVPVWIGINPAACASGGFFVRVTILWKITVA